MPHRSLQNARLVALFFLGCSALLYPLISLFNRDAVIFGIPLLYAYLYGTWAALIVLARLAIRRSRQGDKPTC